MQEAMNRTAEAVASPPATPAGDTGFLNSGDTAAWIKSAGDTLADLAVAYAPRLILALIVLVIGLILIKILSRTVHRMLHLKEIDPSISTFLGSVIQVTLWLLLAMSVLGMVGVEVTSFLAMFTAATVAIGFALKETLQNFAAGVIILVKRPFSVGDFIECAGKSGTVQEIRFFDTLVTTSENITVIIPNNSLATTTVTNYARQSTRRMQVVVGIGYEDDIDKARSLIHSIIESDKRFHAEPEPSVVVSELADSSVNLQIRAWTNTGDFTSAKWAFNEEVKKSFDREGINIPYPQMSVHAVKD